MRVSIYGAGYVGQVTAACLAELGHDVLCIDIDNVKVSQLNEGHTPIHEPGLQELVRAKLAIGKLRFSNDGSEGVQHSRVQIITVNTPTLATGADISNILDVGSTIAEHMTEPQLIINKSTAPVGSVEQLRLHVQAILERRASDLNFRVASNPEFLREGSAVNDFMKPERIVIGTDHDEAEATLRQLYAGLALQDSQVLTMDIASAELAKYAANAMLATRISFMNEMAHIAHEADADIAAIKAVLGSDTRIGPHFLNPGCGYGGSCFPKDVKALIHTADHLGIEPTLLRAVDHVNDRQKQYLIQLLHRHIANLEGKTIAIWGLAFKPNTDDVREAPSRVLISALIAAGANIRAYDPVANAAISACYPNTPQLRLQNDKYECLNGAYALVICTEWDEFRSADLAEIRKRIGTPLVIDGRNIIEPEHARTAGLTYQGIGR